MIHTYIYACMHAHIRTHTNIHACIHMHIRTHTNIHACIHMHIRNHIHIHIQTHTCTYIHTYIHTYVRVRKRGADRLWNICHTLVNFGHSLEGMDRPLIAKEVYHLSVLLRPDHINSVCTCEYVYACVCVCVDAS